MASSAAFEASSEFKASTSSPPPYRISTITAYSKVLQGHIDIEQLFVHAQADSAESDCEGNAIRVRFVRVVINSESKRLSCDPIGENQSRKQKLKDKKQKKKEEQQQEQEQEQQQQLQIKEEQEKQQQLQIKEEQQELQELMQQMQQLEIKEEEQQQLQIKEEQQQQQQQQRAGPKRNFGNQITLELRVGENPVNLKLFKNGTLQVAGLREMAHWRYIVPHITVWLRRSLRAASVCESVVMTDEAVVKSLKVCMICADFDIGIKFKPKKLLDVLRMELPRVKSSHEACRHPAVKIKYMHNLDDAPSDRDGVCKCPVDCEGQGAGLSREMHCRKVTVLLFHSGKVVLTGGVTLQQVHDAYAFVVDRIVKPYAHLFKVDLM